MASEPVQVVLLTGLSGSGKSVALDVLEDSGYYCIDNLPIAMLAETVHVLTTTEGQRRIAVSIDGRGVGAVDEIPGYLDSLRARGIDVRLIFMDAKDDTLLRRFAETRRRHPLATGSSTLQESIALERTMLAPLAVAGHRIDTSGLRPNALRTWIREFLALGTGLTSLLFESFGFKEGVPLDADFVFDVRCLPNPFYDPKLRPLTGRDPEVAAFLEKDPAVGAMLGDIHRFIATWLPAFQRDARAYVTVAIGCTGGQHRSVYAVEHLARLFQDEVPVLVRHRQIAG